MANNIEHFTVSEQTQKIIRLLAETEKRSISQMIRVLVEEAIEKRGYPLDKI